MMFFKGLFPLKPIVFSPFLRSPFASLVKSEILVNKLTPIELLQTKPIKNLIAKNHLPRRTKRSQKGLFHGVRIKSGNQTCFSEKKTRRKWFPNIINQWFKSDILGKKLRLQVTTKAYRCMKKVGGFDNYVLMTKPKRLDSIYGEYLRKLMLLKLNDPSFQLPKLTRAMPKPSMRRRKKHRCQKPVVLFPRELRDKDRTMLEFKNLDEMNRDDAKKYEEISRLEDRFEDIPTNHPLIKEIEAREAEDIKKLEPDRQKIMARYERMTKKKTLAELTEFMKEANDVFEKEQELDYVNVRESRKSNREKGKIEKKAKKTNF